MAPRFHRSMSLSIVLVSFSLAPDVAGPQEVSKIAFVTSRDGNEEIYVVNSDGSGLTKLTQNPDRDFAPAWSPDGSKIAFRSDRGEGFGNLYVMDADGSSQTRLVTNAGDDGSGDYTPHWSPGGSKILFYANREGADYGFYVVNADGSSLTNLTLESGLQSAYPPSWSADGSKILCESGDRTGQHIHVMNPDGTDPIELAEGMRPAWSPDGSKIVFGVWTQSGADIYLMNADGSERTRLTEMPEGVFAGVPSWSPDGTKIAFNTMSDDGFGVGVIDSDGSDQGMLDGQAMLDLQQQFPISWSPDGTKVALMRMDRAWAELRAEGKFDELKVDIFTLNVDGTGLTRLTDSGMDLDPVWSPTIN